MTEVTTISPTTNEPIVTRKAATLSEIQALPITAQKAFQSWRLTSLADRQSIVSKALEILGTKEDALCKDLCEHMGRPISSCGGEIKTAIKRGQYMLKISSDTLKNTPGEPEEGFQRYISKVPVGAVLIIFPWNYPYLCIVNALIPALLAGNTVVLKPSPQTQTVAEHVAQVFSEAGLPQGVLQYFHSEEVPHISDIVASTDINLVCFTGSVATGRAVSKTAGNRFINVGLELGGKDPAYVRKDVDVKWAATEIVDGAIFNSGQSCCSLERVYVDESIHDSFVAAAKKELEAVILGDPREKSTTLGPVVSKAAKKTIESHIADALKKGAKDETPNNSSFSSPQPAAGNWVKPTLLTGVTHDMQVMRDETFGPVIPVMKVSSDEEAVKLMNDSEFGLTASIWTKDVEHGHKLAEGVDAGTVFVNRCDYPSPDLAWTGWKNSGRGQTLSRHGFDNFVKLKSFHVKAYPAGK